MNKNLRYSMGVLLVAVLCNACSNEVKLPSLKETFSQKDKNPFGAFVLHNLVQQLYYHNSVRSVKNNFEKTWRDISDTGSLYINVSKNLFLTKADLAGMLAYVHKGNSIFISSGNIDKHLLDTLGCDITQPFYDQFIAGMKNTSTKLERNIFNDSIVYQYFYFPFSSHFIKLDTLHSRILGNNMLGSNFIVVFHGKGRFYLHTEPRALGNYFLLQKDNYQYFRNVFSFTPAIPEHVYWDDYYNKRNYPETDNKSTLSVLLQYSAMAWAFWLLLLLFGLYIFFGGKRRQRIVTAISPPTNTTIAFTETIGRLYLQKKDNRTIADKIITYFLEHIRNQYYVNTSVINEEFISAISRKSNNTKEGVEKLFETISTVQQSTEVSDGQLLFLNQQIENFYKNKL